MSLYNIFCLKERHHSAKFSLPRRKAAGKDKFMRNLIENSSFAEEEPKRIK
jgi:hypothetical protein